MSDLQPALPSKTNKEFHDLIVLDRVEGLRAFLENPPQGFNINDPIKAADELTGMHYAVLNGKDTLVHLLLEFGADPNACDKFKQTVLHQAASDGAYELIPELLAHGASLNERSAADETPFAVADIHSQPTLSILLNAGANPDDAGTKGFTNLHTAAIHNVDVAAQQLLEAGADPLALTADGRPPLHFAETNHADGATRLFIADYAKLPRLEAGKDYRMDELLAGEKGHRLIDNPYNWRHGLPEQLGRLSDAGALIAKEDWLRPMTDAGGRSIAETAFGARQGDAVLSLLRNQGEPLTGDDLFDEPHATTPSTVLKSMQEFGQLGLLFERKQAVHLKPKQLQAAYDKLPETARQHVNLHSLTVYVGNQQRHRETATGQGHLA